MLDLLGEDREGNGVIDQCGEGEEGEERCVYDVRGRGGGAQQTLENVMGGGEIWGGGEGERSNDELTNPVFSQLTKHRVAVLVRLKHWKGLFFFLLLLHPLGCPLLLLIPHWVHQSLDGRGRWSATSGDE